MEDGSSPKHLHFDKYDEMGAYHWTECDRTSPRYNPPLEARYRVLAKRLQSASRVLDVGCGDGYLMGLTSPVCNEVLGVDVERGGVKHAAAKLRTLTNCAVVQASCYQIPFEGKSFDYALMADVIEHLDQPEICIREITRVLTTDGTLLLTTPKWRPDRRWDKRHHKEYRPEELAALLRNYFSDVTMTFFWPRTWSRMYSTKIGWRAIRIWARYLNNPFLKEGKDAERYGQIFAACSRPCAP